MKDLALLYHDVKQPNKVCFIINKKIVTLNSMTFVFIDKPSFWNDIKRNLIMTGGGMSCGLEIKTGSKN